MAIKKILDISTSHAVEEDFNVDHASCMLSRPEGLFVILYLEMDLSPYSVSFKAVVSYARKHGCGFILFDRDGEVYLDDHLTINNW
jgi:hypothetical protein